jgi:hypothetical protein
VVSRDQHKSTTQSITMAKKNRSKQNLKPTVAAGGSGKSRSVNNGGGGNKVSKPDDKDFDDFLEYVFLAPSTDVVLAEAITWSDILEG